MTDTKHPTLSSITNLGSKIPLTKQVLSSAQDSPSPCPVRTRVSTTSAPFKANVQFDLPKISEPEDVLDALSGDPAEFSFSDSGYDNESQGSNTTYKKVLKSNTFPASMPSNSKSSFSRSPKYTSFEPSSASPSKFKEQANEEGYNLSEKSSENFEKTDESIEGKGKEDPTKNEIKELLDYCKKINPEKKREDGIFGTFSISEFKNFLRTKSHN